MYKYMFKVRRVGFLQKFTLLYRTTQMRSDK